MNKMVVRQTIAKKAMVAATLKHHILPSKSGDTNLYGKFSAYAGQTGPVLTGGGTMTQMSALVPHKLNRAHNVWNCQGGGRTSGGPVNNPYSSPMAATSSGHMLRQATFSLAAEMHHGPQFI